MQFQQDGPKDKEIQPFKFFTRTLEKFRSTELYHARLEGARFFSAQLTNRTPLNSSRLGELKYAFFSSTGRKTKKCVGWTTCAKHGYHS